MQTSRALGIARSALLSAAIALGASCGGGDIVIHITTPAQTTVADGQTQATIEVSVLRGTSAVSDTASPQVTISTDLGNFAPLEQGETESEQQTTATLTSGSARVQLFSNRSGTANLTVTYSDANGSNATAKGTVVFGNSADSSTVSSIEWVHDDETASVVNLADSFGTKALQLQFRLLDSSHSPVSDGVNVTFSLGDNHGDASLAVTSAKTANGTGLVSTTLNGGFINGSVTVTATADNGVSGSTSPIPVQGGPADLGHMSFVCDNLRVAGFEQKNLTLNCTATIGDRNSAFAPNVQVSFDSEAGTVSQAVITSPDPVGGLGIATMIHQTGNPEPVDVPPSALDDGISTPNCALLGYPGQTGTCNPRDGWVTLIAYAAGDECYTDNNGNGKYDEGIDDFPPECDQGEPFIDANDNGVFDTGERYKDIDQNGSYTPANGRWDSAISHDIWRQTTVVWTGTPSIVVRPTTVSPSHCDKPQISFTLADANGNLPASDGDGDAVSVSDDLGGSNPIPASLPLSGPNNAVSTDGYPSVDNTQFSFTLHDADGCSSPPPDSATPISITLDVERTLDDSGVAAQSLTLYDAVTGSFP